MDDTAKAIIKEVFDVDENEIKELSRIKNGMTNSSFLFQCKNQRYIIRTPGLGTEKLVNRKREAEVYRIIAEFQISDNVIYIDAETGYKIAEYFPNARVCNPDSKEDLQVCMEVLRNLHNKNLKSDYRFDIYEQICFYEGLRQGIKSQYDDYEETKANVFALKEYIDQHAERECLSHIDANPDNFLFVTEENGKEICKLIDWEYAGMQDPDVDVAMFCLYAMYERTQVDELIDIYFKNQCRKDIRIKIYCYIAACGLLWSNWCEYKHMMGIQFGDYAIKQYMYAKEYFQIVQKELER